MRLGLFGGTFDPVHIGHLDVAREARRALDLDYVWLVPARLPPHRRPPYASAAHRFAMAALAVAGEPGLMVSDLEMDATGPSYTTVTLDRLAARGADLASVFFVTGADAFRDITTWKDYPSLLDRCHFVAVSRPGTSASALRTLVPAVSARMIEPAHLVLSEPRIVLVDAHTAPVSSTEIRRAVAAGESFADAVPASVARHIHQHALYTSQSDPGTSPQGAA